MVNILSLNCVRKESNLNLPNYEQRFIGNNGFFFHVCLTDEYTAEGDEKDEDVAADGVVVGAEPGGKELDLGIELVLGQGLQHPRSTCRA